MSNIRALIGVKRVLDYALKPRINKSHTGIDLTGQKMSMNPFCEIAVEEAVQLRERYGQRISDILAVSCGPKKSSDVLRNAMAMGADRSIHIKTEEDTPSPEPLAIAKMLKAIVEKEDANLVILGKQSIDSDNHQTGQMLAGLLDWPQATCASKVELNEETISVDREVDGGIETLSLKLPAVITTDLRLNKPRYLALGQIMKAKKRKMDETTPKELNVSTEPRLERIEVHEPPARQGGKKVDSVDSMVSSLKELGAL